MQRLLILLTVLVGGCSSFRTPKEFDYKLVVEAPHFVQILDCGHDALLTRIHLIRSAKKSIDIQTFIWSDDEVGRFLFYELLQAAKRGVKVRIIADQMFSSISVDSFAYASSAHPNLEIALFNPNQNRLSTSTYETIASLMLEFKSTNMRMHNKVFIADEWAITGGRNIENCYFDRSIKLNFKDRDLLVRGRTVDKMRRSFENYWSYPLVVSSKKLVDVSEILNKGGLADYDSVERMDICEIAREVDEQLSDISVISKLYTSIKKVNKVAFIADEPHKNSSSGFEGSGKLNEALVYKISKAKSSVVIQSPYLVLTDRAVDLFQSLRDENKNIELTFSTNSLAATDSWPTYAFLYKHKKVLIDDLNVRLFEYKPFPKNITKVMPFYPKLVKNATGKEFTGESPSDVDAMPYLCLHAKTMVIDKQFSFIGSYNVDPRSANLNTEVGILVWDDDFAETVYESIKSDCWNGNSWVTWKKKRMIGLSHFNDLMSVLSDVVESLTTVDLWPTSNASCFELKSGARRVDVNSPDFYKNYQDVGNFPMVPLTDEKAVLVQLFRSLGAVFSPLL